MTLSPELGLQFRTDQNQSGSQVGLRNAAQAWALLWDLLTASGWTPQRPRTSHRCRVILLNGEKHSDGHLTLNPAFSDWVTRAWEGGAGTTVNIYARDAESFRASRAQVASDIARAVAYGRRSS